ncbi:hypothetical protein Droror1_Dr00017361, partial [Drosera rotundifolia]
AIFTCEILPGVRNHQASTAVRAHRRSSQAKVNPDPTTQEPKRSPEPHRFLHFVPPLHIVVPERCRPHTPRKRSDLATIWPPTGPSPRQKPEQRPDKPSDGSTVALFGSRVLNGTLHWGLFGIEIGDCLG